MSDIYVNEAIGDLRRALHTLEDKITNAPATEQRIAELETSIAQLKTWNKILADTLTDRNDTLTAIKNALGITESPTTVRLRQQLSTAAAEFYQQEGGN